jgi:hypothetical protein
MVFPENPEETDWFGKGWAVYKGDIHDDAFFPPLNDMEAQRWWLEGFGAAWTEYPDDEAMDSILYGDGMGGESVDEALSRALEGRGELLRQLRAHGSGRGCRMVH